MECIVCHSTLTEPVLMEDGHTYDLKCISHWMKTHGTSPMTRQEMSPVAIGNKIVCQVLNIPIPEKIIFVTDEENCSWESSGKSDLREQWATWTGVTEANLQIIKRESPNSIGRFRIYELYQQCKRDLDATLQFLIEKAMFLPPESEPIDYANYGYRSDSDEDIDYEDIDDDDENNATYHNGETDDDDNDSVEYENHGSIDIQFDDYYPDDD